MWHNGRRERKRGQRQQGKGENKSAKGRETETSPEDGEGMAGDVPGYQPTPEDLCIREVYRDWFHANPGTHLDRGVRNDSAWQAWWRNLTFMPLRRYDAPSGKFGRRFVGTLVEELKGVRDRQWNSERFIVFQTVILQQSYHVTASQAIHRRIENCLDA